MAKKFMIFFLLTVSVSSFSQTLVGYWPFTGNAGDSSGNGNHGNVSNAVLSPDRFSNPNRSYSFNGTNARIFGSNPGTNFPSGNNARTIVAWVKSNYITGTGPGIFHYGHDVGGAPVNFHLNICDLSNGVWMGNGGGYGGAGCGQLNIGDTTWHFIAATYDGSVNNTVRIYIDGYLKTIGTPSNIPNTNLVTPWNIGSFLNGGVYFSGRLDDIRIYSGVLSNIQATDLFVQTTGSPNLIFPANSSSGNSLTTLLDWDSLRTSTTYRVQVAADSLFNSIVFDSAGITRSQITVPPGRLNNNTRYFWHVRNIVNGEVNPWSLYWDFRTALVGIQPVSSEIPVEFLLTQNYPNPFNPTTNIKFQLPNTGFAELKIFDALGREITVLVNEQLNPGTYEINWDASQFASGVYYYRLASGEFSSVKKMIIIR